MNRTVAAVILAGMASACTFSHRLGDPAGETTYEAFGAVREALERRGHTIPEECRVFEGDLRVRYLTEDEWISWCGSSAEVGASTVYHSYAWGACFVGDTWVMVDWPHRWDRALIELRAGAQHFTSCMGLDPSEVFYSGTDAVWGPDGSVESDALRILTGSGSLFGG